MPPPLIFVCPRCGRRIGVAPELAGRKVRCAKCREVVVAPAAATLPPPPPGPVREGAESILGDPDESEDSVIGGGAVTRRAPLLPPELPPVAPRPPSSHTYPTAQPIVVTPPPQGPAEAGNPFAGLGGDRPVKPESSKARRGPVKPPPGPLPGPPPAWAWVVMAALAGYGLLMTVVAVWGWFLR